MSIDNSKARKLERLRDLNDKFCLGLPLDPKERMDLHSLLRLMFDGYDVRNDLGITPKRGPRPQFSLVNEAIAGEYWALRQTEQSEKNTTEKVATHWGVSQRHVREVKREHEKSCSDEAESKGWEAVMEWSSHVFSMREKLEK